MGRGRVAGSTPFGYMGTCHVLPPPVAPVCPGSPLPARGDGPGWHPGLDQEVPFLPPPVIWPHPVAGPLQHLLPPHPTVPTPRIPGAASHRPAWLSGSVSHPKLVPVPAEPDSAQRFPKSPSQSPDVWGSPEVPSPSPRHPGQGDGPDGAAGSQFLPRELVWRLRGGDRAAR